MKLIIFLIFFLSAFNATIAYAEPQINNETIFEINGPITHETREEFIKRMGSIKGIILNSKGGIMEYAYSIAALIKTYQITTIIPNNGVCESACTIIFQAGSRRSMHHTASLMYHGIRYRQVDMQNYFTTCPTYPLSTYCTARYEGMKQYIKNETLRYFNTLEKYGVSHDLFMKFVNQPIDPQWLQQGNLTAKIDLRINAEEALNYNIATDIIE